MLHDAVIVNAQNERDILSKVPQWLCMVIPVMYFGVRINHFVQRPSFDHRLRFYIYTPQNDFRTTRCKFP